MSDEERKAEAEVVRDLTLATMNPTSMAQPTIDQSVPYITIPNDAQVADLEYLLPKPHTVRGVIELFDAAAFTAFVSSVKNERTRLYTRLHPSPGAVAVFDDVDGWREHRATYACPLSVEWKTWMAANKKAAKQADFAQFIEDNLPDIVAVAMPNGQPSPSGADMLEVSRTLEAKKNIAFASAVRLDNGAVDFTYTETIDSTASRGQIQIPQVFYIGIPILEGGDRFPFPARLRYRIGQGGDLALWYDLERPHKVLEQAVNEVFATIADGTGLQRFNGSPADALRRVRVY